MPRNLRENEREKRFLKKFHYEINKLKPPDRTNEFSFALLNVLHIMGERCPFFGTKYSIIKVPKILGPDYLEGHSLLMWPIPPHL